MARRVAFLLAVAAVAGCRANPIPDNIKWTEERAAEAPPVPLQPLPLPTGFMVPVIEYRVDDRAELFSAETRITLQKRLVELVVDKGVSVVVLMVRTVKPITIDQFAVHVAERNHVEGILILMSAEERDMRILVGPGAKAALEGFDVGALVNEQVKPHLDEENYATALTHAVRAIDEAIRKP